MAGRDATGGADGAPPRSSRGLHAPLPRQLVAPVRELGRRVPLPRPLGAHRLGTAGPPVPGDDRRSAIVDCALYERGARRGGRVPLGQALETVRGADGGFLWIGLHEPTAAEFQEVAAEFGLHPLAVEDAVHAHQRPKLEVYGDIVFAVLKTARYVDPVEVVDIGELMLFLGPDFVVTVRHGAASDLGGVRQSLEARPDLLAAGPVAVLYAVADRVVDDYAAVIAGLGNDIDEIEAEVFSASRDNHAERIYKLKREVLEFRRAVAPLADPMDRLARGAVTVPVGAPVGAPAGGGGEGDTAYFRDVHDHVLRETEQVEAFDELLNGALNANLAQVTMRQNEDMRKISAWVAIATLITMIAGVYGMNFEHMPELGWRFGYPLVLGVMAVSSMLLHRAFRRSGWL